MNKSNDPSLNLIPNEGTTKPRDLSDFCQKWNELKIHVSKEQLVNANLSDENIEVINWLTILADKVCHTEEF